MDKDKIKPVIVKKDTLENWQKAKNYIPLVGIIIAIEMPDGTTEFKLGDGKTPVTELIQTIRGIHPKVNGCTLTF